MHSHTQIFTHLRTLLFRLETGYQRRPLHSVFTAMSLGMVLATTTAPSMADFPITECNPAGWPVPPTPDATVLNWCDDHPGNDCDLTIFTWNLPGNPLSPQIRMGYAISASAEKPRFFYDATDNRYYTKLYSQFQNESLGLAPVGEVEVEYSYKVGDTPADPADPAPWTPAGTVSGSDMYNIYPMNIPTTNLGPGAVHTQQQNTPVCWSLGPGENFPQKFTLKAEVKWDDDDIQANNTAYSFYDLTTYDRQAQIGFAIDLSGSMASYLDAALQKALNFAFLVEADDQLGVYGFATSIPAADKDSFTATYKYISGVNILNHTLTMDDVKEIFEMQTVTRSIPQLVDMAQILTQDSYNCTPVGQGLLRARKGLSEITTPAGAQKAIVIFSDGLQNVPPFVNTTPSWNCGSGPVLPIIDAVHTFSEEEIKIYSVFFGPTSGYGYDTMWQIQDQTGGDFLLYTSTELELAAAYYAIRGLVDDMVFFEEKASTSPASPGQFEVEFDAAVDLATVSVSWPLGDGGTKLKTFCRQNNQSDWLDCASLEAATAAGTPALASRQTKLSFQVFRFHPGANTTWQFQVRQIDPTSGSTDYTAAVFSAVQEAALFPSLDSTDFETGEALPIFAELISAGAGLTGAEVTATVRVPTRAFGNTLRTYTDRFSKPPSSDNQANGMTAQLQKFLLEDTGSDQIYTYKDIIVLLRDDGQGNDRAASDGIYSGALPGAETHVAGDYQVTITAKANLSSGRSITRTAKLSAICNVGSPDTNRTGIDKVVHDDLVDGFQLATIKILWADQYGNAPFPGTAAQINVTPKNATLRGPLVDNLDSTFTQVIAFTPGTRPDVKVKVRDVNLGTFSVVELPFKYRYEASLHVGAAQPHGAFGNSVYSGPTFGLDLTYRIDEQFGVRGELGYDRFDKKSDGSQAMVNLSLYMQYRRIYGLWEPYFEFGVGYYDLEDDGSAPGFAGGIGAMRSLTPRWSLDFNLQGHRVGGGLDLSYSRMRVGAIYKF